MQLETSLSKIVHLKAERAARNAKKHENNGQRDMSGRYRLNKGADATRNKRDYVRTERSLSRDGSYFEGGKRTAPNG